MSIRIEAPPNSLPVATSLNINTLPKETIISIIKYLDFDAYLSSRLVCHHWKLICKRPDYEKSIEAVCSIKKLSFREPKKYGWVDIPDHWKVQHFDDLKISSYSNDIISIHPPTGRHSSAFISFNSPIPSSLSDCYIFLAKYNDTYFLTDNGNKLIIKNFLDSSKDQKLDLGMTQIKSCFPISESYVVTVTLDGAVRFWNLSDITPATNYHTLTIEDVSNVFKVGDYLILNKKIIDLISHSISEHELTFNNITIKACDSGFCTYTASEKILRYFSISKIDNSCHLNKQWDLNRDLLLEHYKHNISNITLEDVNEQYIVLKCCHRAGVHLLILNCEGEVIHKLDPNVDSPYESPYDFPNSYPLFLHVSGDILFFKHPSSLNSKIYFWHIPTKRFIRELEIEEQNQYHHMTCIQDICLDGGTLTILLSSYDLDGNEKYCIIQSNWGKMDDLHRKIDSI